MSMIEKFGNYVLLKKLATGGMAEVFLARPAASNADGRLLVVKRVLPHIAKQTHFQKLFRRETEILMGLTHPRIVQLYDFGIVNNQPYIAMEYIEGKSLREIGTRLRATQSRLPMSTALDWVAQAAAGLHYAHTFEHKTSGKPLNTIHRDLSPQNLIVSFDGNLKIVDFGIAKADGHAHHTTVGTVKGTVGYLSPEQLHGGKIGPRTDIFSLGVVAWELLTGEGLFAKPGDSEAAVLLKMSQFENHVLPPSTFNREIPFDIDRAILRALEKDQSHRYRHAREFAEELRRLLVKHCPDHVFTNAGEILKKLFKEDIRDLRKETCELNQRAKDMLSLKKKQESGKERGIAFHLAKMEVALQQKATTRHYVLLAIYIASIIALKFDDLHQIWRDRGTQRATAEYASVAPQPVLAMNSVKPQLPTATRGVKPPFPVATRNTKPQFRTATRTVKPPFPPATRTAKRQSTVAMRTLKPQPARNRSK
jgi:serine/threonine protein kinase